MVAIIVAEKSKAATAMATALGGTSGSYQGTDFEITHLRGHLYEFAPPDAMVDPARVSDYKIWDLAKLPWDPADLSWKRMPAKDVSSVISALRAAVKKGDEIVCATDLDPSGEGDLLFWEAIDELGMHGKKFSRMEFTDELPTSLQQAFANRRAIVSMADEGDFRKADYRSKFDFLSMQWSRVATIMAKESGQDVLLRQGRLKSAMVRLVGDQLKAYNDYVKKPFFQNRFRDENDVIYTNPEEPRFATAAEVPQQYQASPVIKDSATDKATSPPKLLDLAGLSTLMAKGGVKPAQVLKTYQNMYENAVVSYPRTEDKTVTPEQFNELSPLVDKIAGVVGIDIGLLTHREPRSSHVKAKGAHGANRPGPKVPGSLSELSQYGPGAAAIYEALAKNYLAMLADDYRYVQQKGHLEKYPDFKGLANVPTSPGWKAVFNADAGSADAKDENESSKGLGTTADPFAFEGANKRPPHPSMDWLMKQLEKHDVGTGSTRTNTYAEVTNDRARNPLLKDSRSKLTLAEAGTLSWHLLPNTRIGDLSLTEKVQADMRAIAEGSADTDQCLALVADWVREDMAAMKVNAASMRSELGLTQQSIKPTERVGGVWSVTGKEVSFSRAWGGHRFSDDEITDLLAGKEVSFHATSQNGKEYDVYGELAEDVFKGKKAIRFVKKGFGRKDASGQALPPKAWCKHTFTNAETADLMAGKPIEGYDFVGQKGPFAAVVQFREEKPGEGKKIVPDFKAVMSQPPLGWGGVTFTDDQRAALAAGQEVQGKGFRSKKGSKYDVAVVWKDEGDGAKRIVPLFAGKK